MNDNCETEKMKIINKFELYCMVFYVLDTEWDENKNPQLGEFLSGANPFLFDDIGSADPTIYLNQGRRPPLLQVAG